MVKELTDQDFDNSVKESTTPVLVDFWGDHCPACRQISPILQGLAGEYAGRVAIVKMHAAENPATSTKLGVRAMPTILAFKHGRVVGQLVGARPKSAFTELIERTLTA